MTMSSLGQFKFGSAIFDLDGTLIDSAPSILAGLEMAIKKSGLVPTVPLCSDLIGPPLRETFIKLVGNRKEIDLNVLISDFKSYYDSEGFKKSIPYPGIEELLRYLKKFNLPIYLATNKRLMPTLKIIDYFGWTSFFNQIYSIDKFADTPFINKTLMMQTLLEIEPIEKANAIYIGDRIEDLEASQASGIDAILVDWGYGNFKNNPIIDSVKHVRSPEQLLKLLVN